MYIEGRPIYSPEGQPGFSTSYFQGAHLQAQDGSYSPAASFDRSPSPSSYGGQQGNPYSSPFRLCDESHHVQIILTQYGVELCMGQCSSAVTSSSDDLPPCLKAHSSQELRRYPLSQNGFLKYQPKWCPQILRLGKSAPKENQEGGKLDPTKCKSKDHCGFSHSANEIKYHPLVYRTELCSQEHSVSNCNMACHLAHDLSQVRSVMQKALSINEQKQSQEYRFEEAFTDHFPSSLPPHGPSYLQQQRQWTSPSQDFVPQQLKGSYTEESIRQSNVHITQELAFHASQYYQRKGSECVSYNPPKALQYGTPQGTGHHQTKRKNTMSHAGPQYPQNHHKRYNAPNQNQYNEGTPSTSSQNIRSVQDLNVQYTGRAIPYRQPQLPQLPQRQNSFYGTQNVAMNQCIPFLDLNLFKTIPCTCDPLAHNLKKCPYYHDYKKDRRRPLGIYQSEKCWYIDNHQDCPYEDNCEKAHNRVEEFYHPDKYKAKFCSSYLNGNRECDYGEFCSFAHNERELSVELIEKFEPDMDFYIFHFKTVWCPYREDDHERDVCVYAHNWQDYRRKPSIFSYSKEMCSNWHTKEFIASYKEGCQIEYRCPCSHGWKEQEFHPDYFKIKPCLHGDACEKPHCPYYHTEADRKYPLSHWFRLFPKTRTVSFSTNFYVPVMGGLDVVHKQTSFSKMNTELICNNLAIQDYQKKQDIKLQQQQRVYNATMAAHEQKTEMSFGAPFYIQQPQRPYVVSPQQHHQPQFQQYQYNVVQPFAHQQSPVSPRQPVPFQFRRNSDGSFYPQNRSKPLNEEAAIHQITGQFQAMGLQPRGPPQGFPYAASYTMQTQQPPEKKRHSNLPPFSHQQIDNFFGGAGSNGSHPLLDRKLSYQSSDHSAKQPPINHPTQLKQMASPFEDMAANMGNNKAGSSFKNSAKQYLEDNSEEDELAFTKQKSCISKGILEIIKDEEEEKIRTSSNDCQLNDEVYKFLRHIDLEFLAECFTGSYTRVTLGELRDMTDDELEKLFEGPLYVGRIRQELNSIFNASPLE